MSKHSLTRKGEEALREVHRRRIVEKGGMIQGSHRQVVAPLSPPRTTGPNGTLPQPQRGKAR